MISYGKHADGHCWTRGETLGGTNFPSLLGNGKLDRSCCGVQLCHDNGNRIRCLVHYCLSLGDFGDHDWHRTRVPFQSASSQTRYCPRPCAPHKKSPRHHLHAVHSSVEGTCYYLLDASIPELSLACSKRGSRTLCCRTHVSRGDSHRSARWEFHT